MFNLALLNPKTWIELALAALLGFGAWYAYNWVYDRGADTVQRKWDSVELERSQQSAKVASDALKVTKDLQASADKRSEETNAQIKTLNTNLGIAVAGLSNRPSRVDASNLPGDTGAKAGCTGAGLYKQDGEFLAREAARADTLRIQLAACQSTYSAARDALK